MSMDDNYTAGVSVEIALDAAPTHLLLVAVAQAIDLGRMTESDEVAARRMVMRYLTKRNFASVRLPARKVVWRLVPAPKPKEGEKN